MPVLSKTQSWRVAFGGTALLEAASAIKGRRLQQFAFEELDAASAQQFANGSFLAPLMENATAGLEMGN